MTDREKVLTGLECLITDEVPCNECPYDKKRSYCIKSIAKDALALLKEQESVIEALKSDLDETLAVLGEYAEIVRCKECKHRGNSEKCVLSAISEEKDFPLFMLDNSGDWFCADGERKQKDG